MKLRGKIIKYIFSAGVILCPVYVFSQSNNISINNSGVPANVSAILDLSANTSTGILLPNVNISDATLAGPVTSPDVGLLVWNTNASIANGFGVGLYYWNGTQWIYLANSGSGLSSVGVSSPLVNTGTSTAPIIGLSTPLAINFDGTGLSSLPSNGQLLIGNGTSYILGNLTAGSGISITNGSGAVTISGTSIINGITANVPAYITGTTSAPISNLQGTAPDKGGILYSNGAGVAAAFTNPVGTGTGQLLFSNISSPPAWTSSIFPIGAIAANSLLYSSTANTGSALAQGANGTVLYSNAGVPAWALPSAIGSNVTGTGTANYLARWISATTLGTGVSQDDSTGLGLSTTAITHKNMLDVNGAMVIGSYAGVNTAPANGMIVSGQTGIGNNAPNSSAILDLSNPNTTSNVGFLPPSIANPTSISSPATGLIVYNTTTQCLQMYNGGTWVNITCQCTGVPAQPGSITGTASVCAAPSYLNIYTYSVTTVTGVSYVWSVPSGANIVSGQGTNSITASFSSTSGNVSVQAVNSCGTSAASTFSVTANPTPTKPGAISGSSNPCLSTSGNVYTCGASAGATSYIWTITGGTNGISPTTSTPTASVSIGTTPGTFTISVKGTAGSCTSDTTSFVITVRGTLSGTPTITAGCTSSAGVIINAGEVYTCATVTNAVSYSWSVINTSAGATVTSSAGTTATVTPTAPGSYEVVVSASNGCTANTYTTTAITSVGHARVTPFTSVGSTTWIAPCGVTQITVKLWGAGGGSGSGASVEGGGASGAYIIGTMTVTPAPTLTVVVGGGGSYGSLGGAGGSGGGGTGGTGGTSNGGGGGGRSAIQIATGVDWVASGGGAGGGGKASSNPNGGAGGFPTGGIGAGPTAGNGGGGGTTTTGGIAGVGVTNGTAGGIGNNWQGGVGGPSTNCGGGGGGGYYGGGGGSGSTGTANTGGGGGGSSYVTNLTNTTGSAAGNAGNGTTNATAPNNADADYSTGTGVGGGGPSTSGGNGEVVIYY